MATFNAKAANDLQVWRIEVLRLLCDLAAGGAGGGGAAVTDLTPIINRLAGDRDVERSIWTDDTGAIFFRLDEFDQGTNDYLPPVFEDLAGAVYVPGVNPQPYSGQSDPAIATALADILAELRDDTDAERSTWTDDTGTIFFRIDTVNQDDGSVATTYESPDGTAYVPGANPCPFGGKIDPALTALLDSILAELRDDVEREKDAWTDDTGAIFYRVCTTNQDDGTEVITYVDAAGAAYTPGANPQPYAGKTDPALTMLIQSLLANLGGAGANPNVSDLLASILAQLESQRDFEETIWTDDTGTVYFVRTEYDQDVGTYVTSYVDGAGAAYVPGANPVPYGSEGEDIELVKTCYSAIAAGTGYAVGDQVLKIDLLNTTTQAITSTVWVNKTTQTTLAAAPTAADLEIAPDAVPEDKELISTRYNAIAAGAGYAVGDKVLKIDTLNTDTQAIDGTVWINQTQLTVLAAAPTAADLELCDETGPRIREESCPAYNCDGADGPVEMREIKVYIDGLYVDHTSTAHALADFPEFGGGDGVHVRSYYQLLNGTNVADADRPAKVSSDPACGVLQPKRTWGYLCDANGAVSSGYQDCVTLCPQGVENITTVDAADPTTIPTGTAENYLFSTGLAVADGTQNATPSPGSAQTWTVVGGITPPGGTVAEDLTIEVLSIDNGDGTDMTLNPINMFEVNAAGFMQFSLPLNGSTGNRSATYSLKLPTPLVDGNCQNLISAFEILDFDGWETVEFVLPDGAYVGHQSTPGVAATVTGNVVTFTRPPGAAGLPFSPYFFGAAEIEMTFISDASNNNPNGRQALALGPPAPVDGNFIWVTTPPAEFPVGCSPISTFCTTYNADGSPNATDAFSGNFPIKAVAPGLPVTISAGATWTPPASANAFSWTSTGDGNTLTTPAGPGPLCPSGGFQNTEAVSYDWSSVVLTAGATGEICINVEELI